MITIKRIVLHNFKRFSHLDLVVNADLNILIGDNESGKSTILQAIDLVARGSRTRVENIGVDKLFNTQSVLDFMVGDRNLAQLPEMYVELYFAEDTDADLYGEQNSRKQSCSGIRMLCYFDLHYSDVVSKLFV